MYSSSRIGGDTYAATRAARSATSPWTEDRNATVRQMAAGGATGAEIAEALGTTRSAVMGYCHRQGIKLVLSERKRIGSISRLRKGWSAPRGKDRFPPGHPIFASRPKGSRAFSDEKIAVAIAAVLAGQSHNKAAKMIGASAQSLIKKWLRDPELRAKGETLYLRAKEDAAARAAAARAEAERLAEEEAARVWAINEPILEAMPHRHRSMLVRRINGETLQEVGDLFGVTRERVRQIEVRWRLTRGLIVPGAKPLNEEAAARLLERSHISGHRRRNAHANLRPSAEISPTYWSEKVERAFATVR